MKIDLLTYCLIDLLGATAPSRQRGGAARGPRLSGESPTKPSEAKRSVPKPTRSVILFNKSILLLCTLCLLVISYSPATAAPRSPVVRPAPELTWRDLSGTQRTTASFRGRPVVVIIAPDANNKHFRSQLRKLRPSFGRLTDSKAVLLVAFSRSDDRRIPSDIPFIVATDGAKADEAFAARGRFRIAIIGQDGNLDYSTRKVLPGQRIVDVIVNSYAAQATERAKQVDF